MTVIKKIPILRALHRYWTELTRPAPLEEFADYEAYWQARMRDGKRATVLDRHRIIARLTEDGSSVLDIGCGDGAFLKYLRTARPACRLMGADLSSTAIAALVDAGIDGICIDSAAPLDAQLRPGWDCIVLMEVIEHVADAEALMRQVASLRPERIFVTIPNVGFFLHRLRLFFGGRFPVTTIIYHMKEHLRFWTETDFQEWATALEMCVVSRHGQVDRPDRLVNFLARRFPGLFAAQMVYELELLKPVCCDEP